MPDYVLYLDDSGTKEYAKNPGDYDAGNTRYFVFGGPLLSTVEAGRLSEDIAALKESCFGDKTVEIKSNWLRMPLERKRRYLDPFGVTEKDLEDFVGDYYSLIGNSDLVLIAGVVDKAQTQEEYSFNPWYPPSVAYEMVLQRVQNEMGSSAGASVIIDDMTGATPKGNQYKKNLKAHHESLRKNGSRLKTGFGFPGIEGLRFVNSRFSHMIQVADVVAYNVYRQFSEYGEAWEDRSKSPLPTYPYFHRIVSKFRQGPFKRVQGYGVAKFPMKKRVPWGLMGTKK